MSDTTLFLVDCRSTFTINVLQILSRISNKNIDKVIVFTCLHGELSNEDFSQNHWCCSDRVLGPMESVAKLLTDCTCFNNVSVCLFTNGIFDVHPYYYDHLKKIHKLKIWMPTEEISCFLCRSCCWWNPRKMKIMTLD